MNGRRLRQILAALYVSAVVLFVLYGAMLTTGPAPRFLKRTQQTMSSTAVYTVFNPTSGTEYVAPSGFWINPTATPFEVVATLRDAFGNLLAQSSVKAIIYDVTSSSDFDFQSVSNASQSDYTGGAVLLNGHVYTVGGSYVYNPLSGASVAKLELQIKNYTGSVYSPGAGTVSNVKVSRSGAWTTPTAIKVRRSGAWVNATAVYVRRNGAWTKVWG